MVRQATANVNSYAADYKDIGLLKNISDKYGITIIAVQHLRKKFDSDPHQMISGSSGLIGAADGSYVLQKEKVGDDTAKLYIRGRDIEEQVGRLILQTSFITAKTLNVSILRSLFTKKELVTSHSLTRF